MTNKEIISNIKILSETFSLQRNERQKRRGLEKIDFEAIYRTGYLHMAVPQIQGGTWVDVPHSLPDICLALRQLATGDSSVALVSAMHPAVLSNWLCPSPIPAQLQDNWDNQCKEIFEDIKNGAQWGTITSEPGSGGDVSKTIADAVPVGNGNYLISGKKHFGSGSGILSNMLTTAIARGEEKPDMFYVNYQKMAWDGTNGIQLVAEWDAQGMTSTQSHSMEFKNFPAKRIVFSGVYDPNKLSHVIGPCLFIAVIIGIVDIAYETAKVIITKKQATLSAYEKVEFMKVEQAYWLISKAYLGLMQEIENGNASTVQLAKASMAELAESIVTKICRIIGGSTLSRNSPFGFWCQDVKALGFLRPPWALAYDVLFEQAMPKN